jgi:hypothetical protein
MFGGRNCQLEAWRALNSQQGHASSVFWRLDMADKDLEGPFLQQSAMAVHQLEHKATRKLKQETTASGL